MLKIKYIFLVGLFSAALIGCDAKGEDPGTEYAPQMYHSVAYEPLTQITDQSAGSWLSSREDGKGEFFNSNVNNPGGINMREPVANTVRRDAKGMLPYRVHKDSIDYAAEFIKNPLESTDEYLTEGKRLYQNFCSSCHGEKGDGQGKVGVVYKGVPKYNTGRISKVSEGHIFHTIFHGKGRMGAHGSQISQEDIWKIVFHVQELQKQ
ncbi:MAG: cytochrome c [Cyclobacteriaceae bacterium]|nr:cytochrome c [Cyclobacteriaceae bacterium]MCH8515175.1 cytochrome c [Cyclobacteriaceae bacterium]